MKLNLPGSDLYDPALPKIYKWNDKENGIAADLVAFVDDLRFTGFSSENAWAAANWVLKGLQFLGIQDSPRKRKPPLKNKPGPWAGGVFPNTDKGVFKMVTVEKWEKGKLQIKKLKRKIFDSLNNGDGMIECKILEKCRGF